MLTQHIPGEEHTPSSLTLASWHCPSSVFGSWWLATNLAPSRGAMAYWPAGILLKASIYSDLLPRGLVVGFCHQVGIQGLSSQPFSHSWRRQIIWKKVVFAKLLTRQKMSQIQEPLESPFKSKLCPFLSKISASPVGLKVLQS